jgi:hypothetical protein
VANEVIQSQFGIPTTLNAAKTKRFTITFTGAAGFGLAGDTITAFTMSAGGIVVVRYIVAFPTTTLTQSGVTPTLALGVVGATTLFLPATTATLIATTTPIWTSVTPVAGGQSLNVTQTGTIDGTLIAANVVLTVGGTANINGGVLEVDIGYDQISNNAVLT